MRGHALNIESGGSRMERFVYGWCPCGWSHEVKFEHLAYADDEIKHRFLSHLQGSF